jgi:acyl-CoA hydrolase
MTLSGVVESMSKQQPAIAAQEIQNWSMVFPNQANPNGNMFGGDLLAIMDTTAAMSAKRYSQQEVSTVSVESVHFEKPFMVGDNIKVTAKVVLVGRSSMMVRALAYKDIGQNQFEACVSAYFTLVAFGSDRKPAQVPRLRLAEDEILENKKAALIKATAVERGQRLNTIII